MLTSFFHFHVQQYAFNLSFIPSLFIVLSLSYFQFSFTLQIYSDMRYSLDKKVVLSALCSLD